MQEKDGSSYAEVWEAGVTADWIAVSERKPDSGGRFLVWIKQPGFYGEIAIVIFDPIRENDFERKYVTHWMRLPDEP